MHKFIFSLVLLLTVSTLGIAQNEEYKFVEASSLTMVGKLFPKTTNPYHRVDTLMVDSILKKVKGHARQSAGIAVCFKTNSKNIVLKPVYDKLSDNTGYSTRGFDLYILQSDSTASHRPSVQEGLTQNRWGWAGSATIKTGKKSANNLLKIKQGLAGNEKVFLLYLPLYSELRSLEIGVDSEAFIEAADNPFKCRIAFFGSSFTHGSSTSRSGMALPSILSRMTGYQFCSLGCSGMSKLQPWFAECLKQADVDAYLLDAFSNPKTEEIKERLFPFIEQLIKARPGVPLIFLKSIYRPSSNYCTSTWQEKRFNLVEKMMKEACEKYPDVYYVTTSSVENEYYEATVDGTHPDNFGYYLWAKSIKDPVMEILAKYGIK